MGNGEEKVDLAIKSGLKVVQIFYRDGVEEMVTNWQVLS